MQQKKSASSPKRGMVRDLHISQVAPTDYIFALNAHTESEDGGRLNISNEPSNYLSTLLPEGYKVVGYIKDLLANSTYLFLTNPETRKSSIGFISDLLIEFINVDEELECDDCSHKNLLGTPLEDVEQIPTHEYIELLNDDCLIDDEQIGLNFDVNFPIKFIEIKQEKFGTTLYWNDYRNPPRWLNVSDVSYLYSLEIPCEEDNVSDCLYIDRLLQFPKYSELQLKPELVQIGGQLKLGVYEFYACYCDQIGNEITDYSTPTNPISIFDENNRILTQPDLDTTTNYALKIRVENLDTNFKYYKVVVAQRTNVNNTQSYFVEGIHPTTDDTIFYTSEANKIRIDPSLLISVKPRYEKATGVVSSDGYLFQWGLKTKKELNLQPVINLLGAHFKWQSSIAKEGLYKSSIATSNYKGWMRNEVQPFAIRFFFKDGGYTANFPIVARPPLSTDLEEVSEEDLNRISLEAYSQNCSDTERTKRWQIFNTATLEELCDGAYTETVNIAEVVERTCDIIPVATIEAGSSTFEIDTEFEDLKSYIEDNPDVTIPEITPFLTDVYEDEHCIPVFGVQSTSGELIVGSIYIIYELQEGDDFSNTGFVEVNTPFIAEEAIPLVWENETLVTRTTCDSPELVDSVNEIGIIENEVVSKTELEFPEDYSKLKRPDTCFIYKIGDDGKPLRDFEFMTLYMYRDGSPPLRKYRVAYERDYNFSNEECAYADDIADLGITNTALPGYFHNYLGAEAVSTLQTTKTTTVTDSLFTDKIHKGALWFKANMLGREKFILEVSKQNNPSGDDDIINNSANPSQNVRISIFDKCSTSASQYSKIFSIVNGAQFLLSDFTDVDFKIDDGTSVTTVASPITGGAFYVVIDTPIVDAAGKETYDGEDDDPQAGTIDTEKFRLAPPDGCFAIATRDIAFSSVTVAWDSITINKRETYQSTCNFTFPLVDDCEPKPFAKGATSYWQSIENYPDNRELYDSSTLKIKPTDLSDPLDFEKYYVELEEGSPLLDEEGNYILNEYTDLTCKPIRHPKLPDNTVSPFMMDLNLPSFSDSFIFPLGVSIDSEVVRDLLTVAKNNGLLTDDEFDSIEGYEILKGDNTINKSVIANGLSFDMYKYTEKEKDVYYANYPHNDLGEDQLHYTNSSRNQFIQHPYNANGNDKFSFISPDLLLNTPALPTEVVFSGHQLGNSRIQFPQVEDFPKWTILGSRARSLALTLAIAETALEAVIKTAELTSNQWFVAGVSSGGSLGAVGAGIAAGGYALQAFMKVGQYRYQWLQIFRDLGARTNFGAYGVSEGYHNRFLKNENESNYLRSLTSAKYLKDERRPTFRDEKTGEEVKVNSFLREYAVFLSLGEYGFTYRNEYKNYDNNKVNKSTSSRTFSSENGCVETESTRNVASPYFTLKNYIPNQWGTVDSIKWLTTNYKARFNQNTLCEAIFGGTVSISRFTWKRKLPFFTQSAFGLADRLPFNTMDYKNIGSPRFFCNYEEDGQFNVLGIPFPDIDSNYNFDCRTSTNRMYIRQPSKFYLWYYGISNFLVESEINCNFRYGSPMPKDQFYPLASDIVEWTQEKNVSIKEQNTFKYNSVYSLPVSNTPYRILDRTYNEELWELRRDQENAVIRSEKDVSQNDFVDPWLINRPLNFNELEKKHGKLVALVDIGSAQIMAIFENSMLVFGAIDTIQKSLNNSQTQILGTGGVFTQRVLEIKTTNIGFAGTQHSEVLSTPYGHFYVDAKRGKVFLYLGGNNLETVSERVGKEDTAMTNWFREHLPFKILKDIPSLDVDNKYKGIGISLGWDERFDRLFLTKKDYVVKGGLNKDLFQIIDGQIYYEDKVANLTDEDFFEDVSWTIAYKVKDGVWSSYFSFTPDFYLSNNDHFRIGFNYGVDKETIWSHNLDNTSFQVFQGVKHPFIVEFPVANENVRKVLNSVSLNVEAKRWQNKWDFAQNNQVGFNRAVIYNHTNNSGNLILDLQKTLTDISKYPKTTSEGQRILFTTHEGKHTFNYFFNRVKNENSNIPQWLWDKNRINKTVNSKAVSFKGLTSLDRMRGDTFIVRLTQDLESRYQITLKNSINDETAYDS